MSAAKREPKTYDEWIVYSIRLLWANDCGDGTDWLFPFGCMGEDVTVEEADRRLLESFYANRPHCDSDLDTIWVLIRG
jgi:hypothetical protein